MATGWTGATRSFWRLLPPAAAVLYPHAVGALYESGRLLDRLTGPREAVAWFAIVASAALVYGVPAVGFAVASKLGRHQSPSSSDLLARRVAHLTVASPALFVLLGVVLYLLRIGNSESVVWSIGWLTLCAAVASTLRGRTAETAAPIPPNPLSLRIAHGTSALLIVGVFLAWHLLNHTTAAFSPEFNQVMMRALRKWYRSETVQPVLVTLMLFQVGSGAILLWRATAMPGDLVRTLQTSTGAFLTAFIVSHLNAVFVLGRLVTKADTTFLWASGAPVGLLPDVWNVRLIPHYSLGVWFVILHSGVGLRGVLRAHGTSATTANRIAWVVGILGAALAITITIAQLGIHGTAAQHGYAVP
jgi:hypothetical protein